MAEARMLSRLFRFIAGSSTSATLPHSGLSLSRSLVTYSSPLHPKGEPGRINTLVAKRETGEAKPPLVLLHGYAAALGFYACNVEALSAHFDVFLLDLPLFGRSSRHAINFQDDKATDAIDYYVGALAEWKRNVGGLEGPVYLAGHSFGGYIAGQFALHHPGEVKHLIMLDPWGLAERKERPPDQPVSWSYKAVSFLSTRVSPLSLVRLGPESFGKSLIRRARGDITAKFAPLFGDELAGEVISDYIYHSNSQTPATGEEAFRVLSIPVAYARFPLEKELAKLPDSIPITFLYGDSTWMDPRPGQRLVEARLARGAAARLALIRNSSHHIYVDNVDHFNAEVIKCRY
jgi:pimeloyl-ACP methyl ester carboxylesterase